MSESLRIRDALTANLDVVSHGDHTRWAVFSTCMRWRYALGRFWEEPPENTLFDRDRPSPSGILVVCALNPSTADHRPPPQGDDNTVRKLMFWAKRDGFLGLIVVNAFAIRSTDPAKLIELGPVRSEGEHNETFIRRALADPLVTPVAAWGKPKRKLLEPHLFATEALGKGRWKIFGMTTDNVWPRHPLYLKNSTKISDWPVAAG